MKGTGRTLAAEWFRLTRGRVALACALFLVALSFLRVIASYLADRSAFAASVQRALTEGREMPADPGVANAYGPFVDGWSAGLTVATLLLLILSSRGIASDIESGLTRVSRTRSVSRSGLVLGRALLGVPLALLCIALTAAGAWLGATWLFEFGPLVEFADVLVSPEEFRQEVRSIALTTLPPLVATWSFGLLVSALSRTGAGAVAGALVVFLGFDLFKEVLGSARYWVFASFNPSLVDNSYAHEAGSIVRGFWEAGFSEPVYRMNLALPWPEAALLVGLACWALSRRAL